MRCPVMRLRLLVLCGHLPATCLKVHGKLSGFQAVFTL